ncbi:uncharacterized mitochondrial protein-like protein [Tanacetum coccineum]
MDSMILNGPKNTLVEYMILSSVDNRPPMDCSRNSVEHATNIILQGLPTDVYALVNHHRIAKDLWEQVQLLMQVNTKFLNSLLPEWSKFVTDVKLVRDLHTTNFHQLKAYMEQHEIHVNEVRIMRERNQDPLALFLSFKQVDDPIDAINKMMSFLSTVVTSHFPTTNNQLRNFFQPKIKATIEDGSGDYSTVQGRQVRLLMGIISGKSGNILVYIRVMKCFNCQGEGHMARQCPKPKRKRDATWFSDKVLLVEA